MRIPTTVSQMGICLLGGIFSLNPLHLFAQGDPGQNSRVYISIEELESYAAGSVDPSPPNEPGQEPFLGVSRLNGIVYNAKTRTCWLTGVKGFDSERSLNLDNFCVALRAVVEDNHPWMSLDPPRHKNGIKEGDHKVRIFDGGKDTKLGLIMVEADYLMKRTSMGYECSLGIRSLIEIAMGYLEREPHKAVGSQYNRFWFSPIKPDAKRKSGKDGSLEIRFQSVDIEILTEQQQYSKQGKEKKEESFDSSDPASIFASNFTSNLDRLEKREKVLWDLHRLYELVACIQAIVDHDLVGDWPYLLELHQVDHVATPRTLPMIDRDLKRYQWGYPNEYNTYIVKSEFAGGVYSNVRPIYEDL